LPSPLEQRSSPSKALRQGGGAFGVVGDEPMLDVNDDVIDEASPWTAPASSGWVSEYDEAYITRSR
jgi:hypothetical protein